MRVAVTLEQCWHTVPGGTAIAALELVRALLLRDEVQLVGVAARHRNPPDEQWEPPLPVRSLPANHSGTSHGTVSDAPP